MERKARQLAETVTDKWTIYPSDGHSMPSELYEFQFLPISFRDSLLLFMAYLLAFVYFMLSLSRLRAIKSKPGLILAVVVQLFCSIMSGFTMCAVYKIDLSGMPQAAYPIVVVSTSLENMFPPDQHGPRHAVRGQQQQPNKPGLRQDGPHRRRHRGPELLLLAVLAYVPVAPIQSFCAFAAIASVIDFFYLSTFFLAVLSVELRRTELSEALEKSSARHHRSSSLAPSSRRSWGGALLHGKTDVSTRIAGTAVMLGFVLIAQWHFFGGESPICHARSPSQHRPNDDVGPGQAQVVPASRRPPGPKPDLMAPAPGS